MDPLADQDKLRQVLSGQSMELCNFLQNVVAITYIFGLQQPAFLLCNFLLLYFATNSSTSVGAEPTSPGRRAPLVAH